MLNEEPFLVTTMSHPRILFPNPNPISNPQLWPRRALLGGREFPQGADYESACLRGSAQVRTKARIGGESYSYDSCWR